MTLQLNHNIYNPKLTIKEAKKQSESWQRLENQPEHKKTNHCGSGGDADVTHSPEGAEDQVDAISNQDNQTGNTWGKGRWPETRGDWLFRIKQEVMGQRRYRCLTVKWQETTVGPESRKKDPEVWFLFCPTEPVQSSCFCPQAGTLSSKGQGSRAQVHQPSFQLHFRHTIFNLWGVKDEGFLCWRPPIWAEGR